MAHSIRVVIAAPHALVLNGLIALINDSPSAVEVVGSFNGIETAERALDTLEADVLLVEDEFPPSIKIAEVFSRLHQRQPKLGIIVLSGRLNTGYLQTVFSAGASGYIFREDPLEDVLVIGIQTVHRGHFYSSPGISSLLLSQLSLKSHLQLRASDMEVLRLIAAGKSVKEIASALRRCSRTIYRSRERIQTVLEAPSNAHLIAAALRKGLLTDNAQQSSSKTE